MSKISTTEKLGPADKKYGYVFGCDGLMSIDEVCEHLSISRDMLDDKCAAGLLRKGKHLESTKVGICRRSVTEYKSRMELGATSEGK